jgi:hypothetical protein
VSVVCLLPARNCADDLPGYLASVARFADAIVALDDGSTDATADALRASPLVRVLLANPRRRHYRGWDDAANRNRLLEATRELDPAWIMSLDADERIDTDDAAAFRRFIAEEARPDTGYLFPVYAMIGDEQHHHRWPLWVGRLFAYRPEYRFPDERLHFVPLPTALPRDGWVRTTLRIKHLAGLTDERVRARHAKYVEVDPGCEFQDTYEHLLDPPGAIQLWLPRPADLPPLDDLSRLPAPPARGE